LVDAVVGVKAHHLTEADEKWLSGSPDDQRPVVG